MFSVNLEILIVFVFLLRNQTVKIDIGELIEMLVCENLNSHRTHSKGSRPQFTLGGLLPHTGELSDSRCQEPELSEPVSTTKTTTGRVVTP